jgi:hypothetical protein
MNKKELLLKSLECYSCLNYVQENHIICNGGGGHRSCVRCFERQKDSKCGICMHDECKEVTDKMVSNIYSFFDLLRDCEFVNCGCTQKLTVNEYDKHIKECIHRLIACPSKKCDHKFESGESHINHLHDKHGIKCIIIKNHEIKIKPLKLKNIVVELTDDMYAVLVSDYLCKMSEFIVSDDVCILNVKLRWIDRAIARNDVYYFMLDDVKYDLNKDNSYSRQITINVTDATKFYTIVF